MVRIYIILNNNNNKNNNNITQYAQFLMVCVHDNSSEVTNLLQCTYSLQVFYILGTFSTFKDEVQVVYFLEKVVYFFLAVYKWSRLLGQSPSGISWHQVRHENLS